MRRLADQGQWDAAAGMCERLLLLDNLTSDVHLLHALILEHVGREAESEQALRRAVYLDRNSALAHYYLGLRQRKNREFSPAARSFEAVLRLLDGAVDRPVFAVVDGVSAGELRQLAQIQLEALGQCEKRSTGSK